mmetsp:Transcript_2406/g.3483  ORF Transcript_2406/g.3483 Transcript_2406/m.3483 type:complete len:631 (-) Transcript_2406:150-2042(-)
MNMSSIGIDKSTIDKLKNYAADVKNQVAVAKNETERQVYDALSNKNWGASSTILNDIAKETYDFEKYSMIMNITWQSMYSPPREWRKVFKALCLLEHLIKNGAERVVEDARDRMHRIKMLSEFNYFEGHIDKGSGVREKSKQLIELLQSNEYIREEREKARKLRDKYVGISNSSMGFGGGGFSSGGGLGLSNFSGSSSARYNGFGSDSAMSSGFESKGFGGGSTRLAYTDAYRADVEKPEVFEEYKEESTEAHVEVSKFSNSEVEDKAVVRKKRTSKKKDAVLKPVILPKKQPEVDLLGGGDGDFDSLGKAAPSFIDAVSAAPANSFVATEWDAFATAQVPVTSAPVDNSFDPFGTSAQLRNDFTAFASPLDKTPPKVETNPFEPVFPSSQLDMFNVNNGQGNPAPFAPMTFPAFQATGKAESSSGLSMFGQSSQMTAPPPFGSVTTGMRSDSGLSNFNDGSTEFGEFQSTSRIADANADKLNATKKWGDVSSLVDLGGLKTNTEKKKEEDICSGLAGRQNTTAFNGLDGFGQSIPMGQYNRAASMGLSSMNNQWTNNNMRHSNQTMQMMSPQQRMGVSNHMVGGNLQQNQMGQRMGNNGMMGQQMGPTMQQQHGNRSEGNSFAGLDSFF